MSDGLNIKFDGNNVPIRIVAKVMKKDETFIRLALQKGVLPIGCAIKKDNSTQYDYYISPKLLYEYSGFIYNNQESA